MVKTRVLVCGATGFIGRNIAEALCARDDLKVVGVHHNKPPFEHSGLDWVEANLNDAADVSRVIKDADVLIQAAATTSGSKDVSERPHLHVTDNAVMNALLFRAAFEQRIGHVVFFSCSIMLQSSDQGLSETDFDANADMAPQYFGAGWTKVYSEKMCEFYAGLGDTRFTVVRHSNVYGPHDKFDLHKSHVFGASVTKVMTARDDFISVWGAGEEARDLLYVGDLVGFVESALNKQKTPFEIYNCGCGEGVKVKDLVAKIIAASGRNLEIRHDLSKPTIPTSVFFDCSKARRDLGWTPTTDLHSGIAKTIAWWNDVHGSDAGASLLSENV